jgi:hypothetical protein
MNTPTISCSTASTTNSHKVPQPTCKLHPVSPFLFAVTMQLTAGAVSMVVNGAHSDSQNINALSPSGKELYSGLVQCKDDKDLRKCMDLEELSPILQVQEFLRKRM